MKKIIAVLAAAFMFGTFTFAEGYICANDLEKGLIIRGRRLCSLRLGRKSNGSQKM